jgi:hypothetical protein
MCELARNADGAAECPLHALLDEFAEYIRPIDFLALAPDEEEDDHG